MRIARVFTAASACVALGAAVAACSGSFGSGSSLPGAVGSPNFGGPPTASPSPSSTSVILTYGTNAEFQPLAEVGGYNAAIAFPKAPEPTAAPSPKAEKGKSPAPAAAPTPVAIAIGASLSVVKPQDGPDLNFESGKGKKKRSREKPARALAYITLLPTHDATLASYPRFTVDIPREIASQYRDGEFGLALWNSGEKDAKYRLAVSELDTTSTPPPAVALPPPGTGPGTPGGPVTRTTGALTTAAPSVRPSAAASGSPVPGASPGASGPPLPTAAPTLPPAKLLFSGSDKTLKLVANRPAVFAVYALPHPASTAAPAAKEPATAKESGAPGSALRSETAASPAARASAGSSGATPASAQPLPVASKAP